MYSPGRTRASHPRAAIYARNLLARPSSIESSSAASDAVNGAVTFEFRIRMRAKFCAEMPLVPWVVQFEGTILTLVGNSLVTVYRTSRNEITAFIGRKSTE